MEVKKNKMETNEDLARELERLLKLAKEDKIASCHLEVKVLGEDVDTPDHEDVKLEDLTSAERKRLLKFLCEDPDDEDDIGQRTEDELVAEHLKANVTTYGLTIMTLIREKELIPESIVQNYNGDLLELQDYLDDDDDDEDEEDADCSDS